MDNKNNCNAASNLVGRSCSVCQETNSFLAYDQPTESIIGLGDIEYHHMINVCNNCGFVYASPLLPEKLILKYYEQMSNYEHPASQSIRPISDINQIERQINLLSDRFPYGFKGKALDIGCSIAYGLSLLKQKGWDVLGLDPSDKCIEVSKNRLNVDVIKGFFSLDLLEKEKPFDLVILSLVLEHLVYPDNIVSQLKETVTDNGLIYIEVPNLMKPSAPKCYFGFEHVNFFTPTSLINLIQQNGFEVDSLSVFDNGPRFSPFYPVIALTIKKSLNKFSITNDKESSLKVIADFKKNSDKLIKNLNTKISKILIDTKKGRLALWGAGIHTSQLLSETSLGNANINCIFDNDPKKAGKRLMGHIIKTFPESIEDIKSEIDAILISSEASETIIYEQLSYLEKQGIKIYCLYINY